MSSQNMKITILIRWINMERRYYLSDSNVCCNVRNIHITEESREITAKFQSECLIDFGSELLAPR